MMQLNMQKSTPGLVSFHVNHVKAAYDEVICIMICGCIIKVMRNDLDVSSVLIMYQIFFTSLYRSILFNCFYWWLNSGTENIVALTLDRLVVLFGSEILKIVPGRVSTEVDARLVYNLCISAYLVFRLLRHRFNPSASVVYLHNWIRVSTSNENYLGNLCGLCCKNCSLNKFH